MKRRTRTPKIHPLSRATAAVLIGLIIAPSLPAKNPFAFDHTGQQEETEFHSATVDSVVSQGANAALEEVVSFVGDSNLPFLGSLQGGVTYDHANGLLRYNLSTVGKLYGNGTGHHWLGQIGAHNEGDRDTVNAGLIYRWIDVNKAWLIGTNLFYDRDFDTGAQRAGFGVEAATQQWRVFSNVYGGISNQWRDALGDDDMLEERVANGYDLGAAWSPGAMPSLDLQLKASRWLGDAVDVFDNDSLHGDPLVWSAKVGYTPIPLLSLAFEQERVVNGDTNNRVDLQFTYRFGQSLAEQLEPSNVARRNDIASRAVAPVERQHRIVMEQREKHAPFLFVGGPNIRLTLAADQALAHTLLLTGGVGAIAFSLEGRDANRFRVNNGQLELAPEVAARKTIAQPTTEELEVIVVARDSRAREARQGFLVVREKKQTPVEGQAPVASALAMQGELTVGKIVTASYTFTDADNDAEGATRVQWYRASDSAGTQRTIVANATTLSYTIAAADVGNYLVVEVTPVAQMGTPAEGLAVSLVSATAITDVTGETGKAPTMQAPTIAGSLAVGKTLTGIPQGFHDEDGDGEGAHRYKWYRATDAAGTQRTAIDGATALQYVIAAADVGKWLVFEVVPVSLVAPHDGVAVSTVTASAIAAPVIPGGPTMQAPTITGTVAIGQTLTGTPRGFNDPDGDGEGVHRYQWYRATDAAGTQRTAIDGANGLQFTITEADVGAWLVFEVIPVSLNAPFDGIAVSTVTANSVAEPPRAPTMQSPIITGTMAVGATLTGTPQGFHDANGDGEGTHRYQWYRATDAAGNMRTAIDGETGLQYTITEADVGAWFVFEVIPVSLVAPHDGVAVSAVTSAAVAEPPQAPTMTAPTITGNVLVGSTLTGTPQGFNDVNGDGQGTHRYQWYRATDSAGTTRTAIDGETGLLYTITEADLGTWLVFEVIPVSLVEPFDGVAVSTVTTNAVAEPPQAPTMTPPTITGTTTVGQTLTGAPQGFHDVNGDGQGTHRYQWYRATDAAGTMRTAIEGETGLLYTITEDDVGAWLVFEVIPVSLVEPFDGAAVSSVTANAVAEGPRAPTMQPPTISGTVAIGATLTGAPQGFHDVNGDGPGTHRYQWYRATDAAGTMRTPIDGQTGLLYTITEADLGTWLVFEVIPVSLAAPFDGVAVSTVTNVQVPTTYANETDMAIPDHAVPSIPVNSPITVSGRIGTAPADAAVYVRAVHPYRGDLSVSLISPGGTVFPLKAREGADGTDNVDATYTVNLSGESMNGVWTLRVTDESSNDVGHLDRWSITF